MKKRPSEKGIKTVQLLWHMMPLVDISERLDLPLDLLTRWQSRGYIKPPVRWTADYVPVTVAEKVLWCQKMRDLGYSVKWLADRLDLSPHTLYRHFNRPFTHRISQYAELWKKSRE